MQDTTTITYAFDKNSTQAARTRGALRLRAVQPHRFDAVLAVAVHERGKDGGARGGVRLVDEEVIAFPRLRFAWRERHNKRENEA